MDSPVKQMIDQVLGGKSPTEVYREGVGGDVEFPDTPDDPNQIHPQNVEVSGGDEELSLLAETAEQKAKLQELLNTLRASQVQFSISENPDSGEHVLKWSAASSNAVYNALDGLGIDVVDEDSPEGEWDYFGHGAEPTVEAAVESVLSGADPDDVINSI